MLSSVQKHVGAVLAFVCVFGLLEFAEAQEWTFCAPEGGVCSFAGTVEVRYGANGAFIVKTLTDGTACTNAVFGDPIVGVVKSCATSSSTPVPKSRVVIVDSTNRELGLKFDNGALFILPGAILRNWFMDGTVYADRLIQLDVAPSGYSTVSRGTVYYLQSGCVGQPYIGSQGVWFQKPFVDVANGIGYIQDTPTTVTVLSAGGGGCFNTTPTAMTLGKQLTFNLADLGLTPPFRAEVR